MAATMHNQDDKHQSLNQKQETSFEEPSWVKPVKIAAVIMGVMILAGLVLLVYGISAGIGKLSQASKSDRVFTYPEGQQLIQANGGTDETLVLQFIDQDGVTNIVHINPNDQRVINTVTLKQGQSFEFGE